MLYNYLVNIGMTENTAYTALYLFTTCVAFAVYGVVVLKNEQTFYDDMRRLSGLDGRISDIRTKELEVPKFVIKAHVEINKNIYRIIAQDNQLVLQMSYGQEHYFPLAIFKDDELGLIKAMNTLTRLVQKDAAGLMTRKFAV